MGPDERRANVAKFETVPLADLKTRLPAKLMPLVEEYQEKLSHAEKSDEEGFMPRYEFMCEKCRFGSA